MLAFISVLAFGLRGYTLLVLKRPTISPFFRIAPHVVNTGLVVLGLYLWHLSMLPLASWFGLKLLLVLTYFAMDGFAFNRAKHGRYHQGIIFYLLGLVAVLLVVWLAVSKPMLM